MGPWDEMITSQIILYLFMIQATIATLVTYTVAKLVSFLAFTIICLESFCTTTLYLYLYFRHFIETN